MSVKGPSRISRRLCCGGDPVYEDDRDDEPWELPPKWKNALEWLQLVLFFAVTYAVIYGAVHCGLNNADTCDNVGWPGDRICSAEWSLNELMGELERRHLAWQNENAARMEWVTALVDDVVTATFAVTRAWGANVYLWLPDRASLPALITTSLVAYVVVGLSVTVTFALMLIIMPVEAMCCLCMAAMAVLSMLLSVATRKLASAS